MMVVLDDEAGAAMGNLMKALQTVGHQVGPSDAHLMPAMQSLAVCLEMYKRHLLRCMADHQWIVAGIDPEAPLAPTVYTWAN